MADFYYPMGMVPSGFIATTKMVTGCPNLADRVRRRSFKELPHGIWVDDRNGKETVVICEGLLKELTSRPLMALV